MDARNPDRRAARWMPLRGPTLALVLIALAGSLTARAGAAAATAGVRTQGSESTEDELEDLRRRLAAAQARLEALERHVPFLLAAAFRGDRPGLLERRARVRALEVSPVPDPETSPYEDCLIAVRARVLEIDPPRAGVPGPRQPEPGDELLLHLWGFRDRRLAPEAAVVVDDVFGAALVSADDVSDELSRLQVSDTLDAFELGVWFGCEVRLGDPARSTRPRLVDPDVPDGATRADALRAVEQRVVAESERHGGWNAWMESTRPFRDALLELRRAASGLPEPPPELQLVLRSEDRRSFERGSDALIAGPPSGPGLTAVEVVADVSRQLAEHGVDFIFVPIPQKTCVYPEWLLRSEQLDVVPEDGIVSPAWRRYVAELSAAGVETVDLLPFLLAAKRGGERSLYLFDHHWAPAAIEIAADLVAQRLARYELGSPGELALVRGELLVGLAQYAADHVVTADGAPFAPDPAAPVIVVGDSNKDVGSGRAPAGVRSHVSGGVGSFAALLSERLGLAVAEGGRALPFEGGTIARQPAGLFRGRRVVVMVTAMIRPAKPAQMPSRPPVLPERLFAER